jgi:hypothetical protein
MDHEHERPRPLRHAGPPHAREEPPGALVGHGEVGGLTLRAVRRVELRLCGRVPALEVDGQRQRLPVRRHSGDQSLVLDVGVGWCGVVHVVLCVDVKGTTGGRWPVSGGVAAMLDPVEGENLRQRPWRADSVGDPAHGSDKDRPHPLLRPCAEVDEQADGPAHALPEQEAGQARVLLPRPDGTTLSPFRIRRPSAGAMMDPSDSNSVVGTPIAPLLSFHRRLIELG